MTSSVVANDEPSEARDFSWQVAHNFVLTTTATMFHRSDSIPVKGIVALLLCKKGLLDEPVSTQLGKHDILEAHRET